jgi:methylated-DNA-[protein]-cysteine S-methyltransferase
MMDYDNALATTARVMLNASRQTRHAHIFQRMATPVGTLTLIASDDGLAAVVWENDRPLRVRVGAETEDRRHPMLLEAERQISEYFDGRRTAFSVRLDSSSGTAFQRRVWDALRTIPFGETRSYGDVARQIGRPEAARAVGAATGRNPVSIITPCHRVVGSTGKLTGFAGGLDAKAHLLALERAHRQAASSRAVE